MERPEARQGGLSTIVKDMVASHIEGLLARGFTWIAIEEAAGLAKQAGRRAMGRKNPTLSTLEALWDVTPDKIFNTADDKSWVPSIGAQRRLLALRAAGHVLEDTCGKNAWRTMEAKAYICASTHRRIAEIYDELKDQDGPSEQNKTLGRHQGWPPPAAWAGIDIDDPYCVPNALEIPLTWEETVDSVRDMLSCGKSADEICEVIGKKRTWVSRKLYSTGHPELARVIARKHS